MAIKPIKPSTKIFLILSALIALLDITFVGITFYQSRITLISNFEKEAFNQHATFRNSFKETTNNMLQIATFVANDPRVQQAFLKGQLAVKAEGGGPGKLLAKQARDDLQQIVSPSWAEVTKQFNARQLHFHLGPGSTSFLRVHKPKKFGDNMDNVRYTIVDANKKQQATTGFETGRVYSGIRGVQPVFATDPKTHLKTHIGAVESGISYHDLINNLSKTFNIDIAILLTMEHIQSNVWPDLLAKRLKRSPAFGEYLVEETTSKDFKDILLQSLGDSHLTFDNGNIRYITWNNRFYVISEMPLRDYKGTIDPSLKDVGKIVFWKDVTETHDAFFKNLVTNCLYAFIAYLLVECLLYLGLQKTTTKLNKIISKKTNQLSLSNQLLQDEIHLKEIQTLELKKLHLAVEQNPTVIVITDKSGIIEYVNNKFIETTGFSREDAIGHSTRILSSGQTPDSTYKQMWEKLLAGNEWRGEFYNCKKNGDHYWAQEYIAPIFDSTGNITHFVAIQEDITESRRITNEINYQVSHDSLTGLINRREFELRLDRVIQVARQQHNEHVFCFFDLDRFKIVNDTSGHPAGDELLRQIASLTRDNIRQRDTLARFGGDEFGILMESCSLTQAEHVAEKIRDMIEHFVFIWDDKSFSIGVSIGLVSINNQTKDITEAFKKADAACYAAKDAGRNRVYVYKENDHSLSNRKNELDWANETLDAIKESRLKLFAQVITPIGKNPNKKLRYEILVRQFTSDGSQISPAQFLPALERYNLATQLDTWVITTLFAFLHKHQDKIANIEYFAINLSGQSFSNKDIHSLIIQLLDSKLVPAEKIVFEITETVAISNINEARQFISSLKLHGCRFALDDFGSGMSSFAYLKNLPVDFLKIDGLFVKDIVDDPIDYAMVKSINEIGHIMGLETIAEFVENDAILNKLMLIDVDCAQGYGLGKPQTIESFFNL